MPGEPVIRAERDGDAEAIRAIHEQAFGAAGEADLVDALRFGLSPASRLGLRCGHDVPDEAVMAVELIEGVLERVSGLARITAASRSSEAVHPSSFVLSARRAILGQ